MVKIYLDSCVVIYLLEGFPELSRSVQTALKPATDAPAVFTSDLTRLECRVSPLGSGKLLLLRRYDDFFASRDVTLVSFSPVVFDLATELRAQHRIKTPDALHLAAALWAGCDEVWTNDLRLRSAARGQIELRIFPAIV